MALRVLRVGLGAMGHCWTHVLAAGRSWKTVAGVDPDVGRRESEGDEIRLPEFRRFADVGTALTTVEADVAVIASPPAAHAAGVCACLSAGLHVLVEKPLALSMVDAREMVDAARRADRILMVGQNYRYAAAARSFKRVLSTKSLGKPHRIIISARVNHCDGPDHYRRRDAEVYANEVSVHHFDTLRYLLGDDAERVSAVTFREPWSPYAGNSAMHAIIGMVGGAEVVYEGTLSSRGPAIPWDGEWRIECARGCVWLGDLGEGWGVYKSTAARRRPRKLSYDATPQDYWKPCLESVAREFFAAIDEGREPETSGADNLSTLAIALAAIKSSHQGTPVAVSDIHA